MIIQIWQVKYTLILHAYFGLSGVRFNIPPNTL